MDRLSLSSESIFKISSHQSNPYQLSKENDMPNTITVTACDNELIVIAYQGGASFEL